MLKDRELKLAPPANSRIWLLSALLLVALPHLLRMPIWLSLGCGAAFLWRLLHEQRGFDLPGKWLRFFLVFLGIGSVLLTYHGIAGRDAGVALLTVMLCLKLLELHTMRDAMIALFIGYFMVITGFLFSQTIFMGGYLFLVVLALTTALITLNHPDGEHAEYRFYIKLAGKLLLQALPLMVLMFLLFPRLSGPLWQMPNDKSVSRTGLSGSMDIGSISKLANSEEVAFRVDFTSAIPPASKLYWRGPVLWDTDGRHWQQHQMQVANSLPSFKVSDNSISYSITLEPNNRRWLFALDLPVIMPQGLNGPVYVRPDFQLLYSRDISNKLRYSVQSTTDYQLTELPSWMSRIGTQLPPDSNPRTLTLARQWRSAGLNNSAIINKALSLFQTQAFYYTRQPPPLGNEPLDTFLFTTRRGFCEHYAAAFVTLMRAAEIPARIVTGYQGGERNALGNYLIVRQSNAHAWAEVWLADRGWIRVDPTSVIPPERVEATEDANRFSSTDPTLLRIGSSFLSEAYWKLRYSWDAINHAWNQWVLGFDQETQKKLLQKLGLTDFSWQWLTILMMLLLGVIISLLGISLLWRRPRPSDPVVRLYQQFCRTLEKAGIVRDSSEGPIDFAERVVKQRPDLSESVNMITKHYIQIRYARNPCDDEFDKFRNSVNDFRI